MQVDPPPQGNWLQRHWPIESHELKKFIPLLLLKALVSFVFGILISIKDTVVVTAPGSGAEVIPVIKGLIVLPTSVLVVFLYTRLSNSFKPSTLFYGFLTGLLFCFFIYGFYLYPNAEALSPNRSADLLLLRYGEQYKHIIAVYRHWIHVVFFLAAELWSQVAIFILYWGFVNSVCKVDEAKRSYNLLIAAGTLALIFTTPLVWFFLEKYRSISFLLSLQALLGCVIGAGLLMMVIYWWVNRYGLSECEEKTTLEGRENHNKKTTLSFVESLKYIASSRYLMGIATTVIACGLTINLVEVTWKANLRNLYPLQADYQKFMSIVNMLLGISSLLVSVLLGGKLLRKLGWGFSARVTPIVVGITGTLFFLTSHFKENLDPIATCWGTTPLYLTVLMGAFQSICSKVAKYSFFDSTKEIVYIPLGKEAKVKGKATVDVIGSRLGKSSSSYVHILILQLAGTSSVLIVTPILIPVLAIVVVCWLLSIQFLDKAFDAKVKASTKITSSTDHEK